MPDSPYMVVVTRTVTTTGEPCYLATHPELAGCMASGRSDDEARANLDDARDVYISALKRRGIDVPEPTRGAKTLGTSTVAVTGRASSLPTAEPLRSR